MILDVFNFFKDCFQVLREREREENK